MCVCVHARVRRPKPIKEKATQGSLFISHLLVCNRVGRLAHELLDVLDAAHLGVDLLQDLCALLQTKDYVLLDEGELDVARELLKLVELRIRLGEQGLLVFFAPQGEEGALLVAPRQHLARNVRLLVRQHRDATLVLVQLIALDLEVEYRPVEQVGERVSVDGTGLRGTLGMLLLGWVAIGAATDLSWAVTLLGLLPITTIAAAAPVA